MKKANREQQKIMRELDHKIDEYYKTHDEESEELYRIQAHYRKKIKRACIFCGKTEREVVHVKDPPKRKLPYFGTRLK